VQRAALEKTSTSSAIATGCPLLGKKTLAIDADMQANLTRSFGQSGRDNAIFLDILEGKVKPKEAITNIFPGLDFIPSNIRNAKLDRYLQAENMPIDKAYSKIIKQFKKDYDIIIIDLPPAINSSVNSAILSAHTIICPINADEFSRDGLDLTFSEFKYITEQYEKDIKFHILLNKVEQTTLITDKVTTDILKVEDYQTRMLPTFVRKNIEFTNIVSQEVSLFDTAKKSNARKDILEVLSFLLGIKNNC